MVIATLFVTLPFVAREVMPVLRDSGLEQEEAAYVIGASRWQAFWRVTLPSIKWGLIYGVTLTVARAIGEFGAVIVVSGNIINRTQSVPLLIHQEFTDYNYGGAYAAALLLAVVGGGLLAGVLLVTGVKKRRDAIPFGPFLALGAVATLYWGQGVLHWYLGLF